MKDIFISYHHDNDQWAKEELLELNRINNIFRDGSVNTGDIPDDLSDEAIRTKIRDEYLKDTTVTIVLVGEETRNRKHVDWEIYSSMFDGTLNKKSGIIVVNLPSTNCYQGTAAHDGEKEALYSTQDTWHSINTKREYEERYPYLPNRLIDNILNDNTKISVIKWDRFIADPEGIRFLIEVTHNARVACQYDLTERMRRSNS